MDYQKCHADSNAIKMKDVTQFLIDTTDEKDEHEIERAARAVAILVIHCFIHQCPRQNDIRPNLVRAITDLGKFKSVAWGAACWINIHRSLTECRIEKIIMGCLSSLLASHFSLIFFYIL